MADEDAAALRALRLAVGLALVEVAIQAAVLASRGALGSAPLRIAFLALKVPFCWAALRRRPGAYLGLWLWEFAGVAAALRVHGAAGPRMLTAALAVAVMVSLGYAARAFPTVEWRSR